MDNLDSLDLDSIENELKSINLELGDNTSNNNRNNNNNHNNNSNHNNNNNHNNNDITDIGLDLLTNKNKQKENASRGFDVNNTDHSISITKSQEPSKPESVKSSEILTDSFFEDNLENINLDTIDFGGASMNGPTLPDSSSGSNNNIFTPSSNNDNVTGGMNFEETKPMSYEEIQKAKFDLLCKFERLRDKGMRIPKTFSMSSDYEEMKYEYDRLSYQRKVDASVKMQRHMLISVVTGMEFLNNKFDPFSIKLDNWSEQVHEGIHDYDDIFEELFEKYKEKGQMAPELRLLFTLFGSAFMFHLSNTMFKSALPGVGDIMKQNPDLMQQFGQAAATSMGKTQPGFGGFMGNILNNFTGGGNSSKSQSQQSRQSQQPQARMEDLGPPIYDPMNQPPFSNGQPPPREMPSSRQSNQTNSSSPSSDIDALLANISNIQDLGDEKEITLDLNL
jgi:hypothetical protein